MKSFNNFKFVLNKLEKDIFESILIPQTNSPKTLDIWPVSKKKYFTQNFGNLASYKKGLNKIGSKMAALKGFSFGHFSKT